MDSLIVEIMFNISVIYAMFAVFFSLFGVYAQQGMGGWLLCGITGVVLLQQYSVLVRVTPTVHRMVEV